MYQPFPRELIRNHLNLHEAKSSDINNTVRNDTKMNEMEYIPATDGTCGSIQKRV